MIEDFKEQGIVECLKVVALKVMCWIAEALQEIKSSNFQKSWQKFLLSGQLNDENETSDNKSLFKLA